MTVEPTQQYRLIDPGLKQVPGQSAPPTHYTDTRNGETHRMKFGGVFQASSQTTNISEYAPGRVHIEILQPLADNGQLEAL